MSIVWSAEIARGSQVRDLVDFEIDDDERVVVVRLLADDRPTTLFLDAEFVDLALGLRDQASHLLDDLALPARAIRHVAAGWPSLASR